MCQAGRLKGEVNPKPQKHLQTSHQARVRLPAVAERGKLSEDEEEKCNQEKALMKDIKSGRAQVRRVKRHLKSPAMSRAKMPVRLINPPKKKVKSYWHSVPDFVPTSRLNIIG